MSKAVTSIVAVFAILGVALVALALYLGLSPVERYSTRCGTGLAGLSSSVGHKDASAYGKAQEQATAASLLSTLSGTAPDDVSIPSEHRIAEACQPALSARRTVTLLVGVPGVALALSAVIVGGIARRPEQADVALWPPAL